jgi:chromosome segregation ATPase
LFQVELLKKEVKQLTESLHAAEARIAVLEEDKAKHTEEKGKSTVKVEEAKSEAETTSPSTISGSPTVLPLK